MKDESGTVGFVNGAPAIAVHDGAARPFYDPQAVAREARKAGVYLIGRVVTFEDPITSAAHPALAVHRSDGSLWHTNGGLGWLNPYSRDGVDIRRGRRRRGGEGRLRRDPVRLRPLPERRGRLDHPLPRRAPAACTADGRRVPARTPRPACIRSASASRPTSSGCLRRTTSGSASTRRRSGRSSTPIYPMTYPSHYRSGRVQPARPERRPGADRLRLARRLPHAARRDAARCSFRGCRTSRSAARTTPADVAAQIAAARSFRTGGFMLWNAGGIYTAGALRADRPPPLPAVAVPTL